MHANNLFQVSSLQTSSAQQLAYTCNPQRSLLPSLAMAMSATVASSRSSSSAVPAVGQRRLKADNTHHKRIGRRRAEATPERKVCLLSWRTRSRGPVY